MRILHRYTLIAGLALVCAVSALSTLMWAADDAAKPAENEATYVGSAACKACHAKVYEPWASSTHGTALLQESLPAVFKGCEACHGPASAHVGNPSQNKPPIPKASDAAPTNALCGKCHLMSNSSKAPKEWQNLSAPDWMRSTHGRKGTSCLTCHTGHMGTVEKALVKPQKELCASCHASVLESSPGKKAAYTHAPVAMGQCRMCHDPHGARDRRMVKADIQKACATCHKPEDPKTVAAHSGYSIVDSNCISCHDAHSHDREAKLVRTAQHGPFKQRKCEMCHTKPAPNQPAALVKPARELCVTCHPVSSLVKEGETAHLPVKEGLCLSCHDPHASNQKKSLMKTTTAYACFTCHSKVEEDTVQAHRHKVLDDKLNCQLCHKPHSAPNEKLLVKDQTALCGQCHKHSFSHPMGTRKDGSAVINPVTKKTLDCAGCHNLHGSKFAVLAKAGKDRDLCVMCHKETH